jgi:hypothetical protein
MFIVEINFDIASIGTILLGVGGFITASLAIRKSKLEGSKTCHELLNNSRKEAEGYAIALHDIRMKNPDLIPMQKKVKQVLRPVFCLLVLSQCSVGPLFLECRH